MGKKIVDKYVYLVMQCTNNGFYNSIIDNYRVIMPESCEQGFAVSYGESTSQYII